MTGYKTNLTGNDNNTNKLVKLPHQVHFPVNIPGPCASSTDGDKYPIIPAYISSFLGACQRAVSNSTGGLRACNLDPQQGRERMMEDGLARRADATKHLRADGPGER